MADGIQLLTNLMCDGYQLRMWDEQGHFHFYAIRGIHVITAHADSMPGLLELIDRTIKAK